MTVGDALAFAMGRLRASESARFDAQSLLAASLARTGAWLLAHSDDALDEAAGARFLQAVERRAHGEPVPYILGWAGFYGRRFLVTPDVLVPRPESELLVTLALEEVRARAVAAPHLCDAGTGSGILAVSLAAEVSAARVIALDISPAALALAERNARAHGVSERVRFVLGDARETLGAGMCYDGIVANLPYVKSADLAAAPAPTSFEPRLALDGGDDGLGVYRGLLERAASALAPGGWLLMEAGADTVPVLGALARETFGATATVWAVRDYAEIERVVGVRLPRKAGAASPLPKTRIP